MNLKVTTMIAALVLISVIYVIKFTDWFRPKNIQIITQMRPVMLRGNTGNKAYPVVFGLNHKYELTSIQVYPAKEFATNDLTPPVWSLTGNAKSEPVKAFTYGGSVPGMKPANAALSTVPLVPGTEYLLIVETEKLNGRTNFVAAGPGAPTPQAPAGPPTLVPLVTPPPASAR